jgi:hypothetical protein
MRMRRAALITVGLLAVFTSVSFLVFKTERLETRVVKQEALIQSSRSSSPLVPPIDLESRIGQLEQQISALEKVVEKKVVRQELDGKLKDIRDVPSDPAAKF